MQKNLRRITAYLTRVKRNKKWINRKYIAHHLRAYLFLVFLILVFVLLQILVLLNTHYLKTKINYENKQKEFSYWQRVVVQFPNIPDILYDAALSAYNVGKMKEAIIYLDRALQVDPLFKKAIDLKNEIERQMK